MSLKIENQNSDSEHRSQVRKKMKKRFDDLHKYMCFLYENTDGYIEIKAIRDSSMGEVQTFYISKIEDMPLRELISLNKDGYNIISGIGTRKSETGGKDSVSEISALWVDIDIKPHEDKRARLKKIKSICKKTGFKDSLLLNSGNGFHLYFKLLKTVRIRSDEDIQEIEAKVRWLKDIFNGDSVSDISRLMRIPGFYNMKNPIEPKKCSILSIHHDVKYELSAFKSKKSGIAKSRNKIKLNDIPDKVPDRFNRLLESDKKVKKTWFGNRDDLYDTSGSGYDMALASMLRNLGFTYEEIIRIILETPYEKKTQRNERYFRHTFSKIEEDKERFDMISSTNAGLPDLTDFTLKDEDFDTEKFEYIVEGFIPKKSLGMFTSKAGEGKSIFGYALTKQLILKGYVVIIVDADMSVNVIVDRLKQAQLRKYIDSQLFYVHHSIEEIKVDSRNKNWNQLKASLKKYKDSIVIFDNLKDLAKHGVDLDRDAGVVEMMSEYKKIREMGNTVIILHHVPKDGSRKHPFKNSGSIADALDFGYILERKDDEFRFDSFKVRTPVNKNVKFILEPDFTLISKDTMQEISEYQKALKVYEFIRSSSDEKSGIQQKDIIEGMKGAIARDKLREILEKWEGKLWNMTKGSKTSRFYSNIELTLQNSKNLPPYIQEKLGILEFKNEECIENNEEVCVPFLN